MRDENGSGSRLGRDAVGPSDDVTRRRFIELGAVAAGSALLAACGGNGGGSAAKTVSQASKAPAGKPDQIVVRTWGSPWSDGLKKTVADAFTKDTGIQVKFDLTDFGPVQAKVQQALRAGRRPPVDIVHTVGFFAERARVQNLTASLDPEIVTHRSQLLPVGLPPDRGTSYVNLYSYTFPVIYVANRISPPAAMSWNDLFDPRYKGSFFAASTFEVLAFPFAKILGVDPAKQPMDKVWERLRQLRPNLAGFGQDSDFVTAMKSGQAKWGAFIVGNAFALRDAGLKVKWLVPKEGSTLSVDSMYVARGLPAEVTYWAQKFVNSVLEPRNLTRFTAVEGVVPTNKLSKPAKSLRGDPAFPFSPQEIQEFAIPLPLDATARNQDTWQAAYASALQH
jgi:putative spermidine/putrescine transport system substrate-binding protein